MTVKDVISLAGELLGMGTGIRDSTENTSSEYKDEVLLLTKAFNLVENELAIDYFPLYCEETLDVDGGRLYYRDLSKSAVRILSVCSEGGGKIPYKIFTDHMRVDSGRVIVKYAYLPATKDILDETEFGLGVSLQMLALGVAAEYCFLSGLYGEAEAWNKKYRAEIATSYRSRPAKSIKERRWA